MTQHTWWKSNFIYKPLFVQKKKKEMQFKVLHRLKITPHIQPPPPPNPSLMCVHTREQNWNIKIDYKTDLDMDTGPSTDEQGWLRNWETEDVGRLDLYRPLKTPGLNFCPSPPLGTTAINHKGSFQTSNYFYMVY